MSKLLVIFDRVFLEIVIESCSVDKFPLNFSIVFNQTSIYGTPTMCLTYENILGCQESILESSAARAHLLELYAKGNKVRSPSFLCCLASFSLLDINRLFPLLCLTATGAVGGGTLVIIPNTQYDH